MEQSWSSSSSSSSWCSNCVPITHGAFLYLALLFLLCHTVCQRRISRRRQHSFPPRNLVPNHVTFWILIVFSFLLYWVEFGAQWLISGAISSSFLIIISPILGIAATISAGIIHHVIESSGRHLVWLTLLIVYQFALGIVAIAKSNLPPWDFMAQLNVAEGVVSISLGLILTHAILCGRTYKSSASGEGQGDNNNIVYTHDTSPLLSRLTFFWFTRLLRLGYETPLMEEHLGQLPIQHTTAYQLRRFKSKPNAKLLWPLLWTVVGPNMLLGGVFRLFADLTGFVAPLGIKTIVNWAGRNNTGTNETTLPEEDETFTIIHFLSHGYIMVGVVLVSSILQATFSQCSTYLVNTEGLHVKVAIQGMIYEKSLRVSGRGEEVINLVGEDANNVMMLFWMAHFVWAIPLKLAILMALLYMTLGLSALVAAAVCILIMLPLQFLIAKAMAKNSKKLLERSDERLGWMSEIVANMRLLKAHAWELYFGDRLKSMRKHELKHLDNDLLYRSIMTFLTHASTVVVTVITFGLYPILEETHLQPAAVFAGLALFNQLTVPLFIFPITVPVIIDAYVSGKRITEFLSLQEIRKMNGNQDSMEDGTVMAIPVMADDETTTTSIPLTAQEAGSTESVFVLENIVEDEEDNDNNDHDGDSSANKLNEERSHSHVAETDWILRLEDATFSWGCENGIHNDSPLPLTNISIEIRKEKLTVIVGPTASGKSTLLSALLGELWLAKGNMKWAMGRKSHVAYVPQKPWILNGTVRENITFGQGFKPRRYKRVIEAVGLQQDIDDLPHGDSTEIGEQMGVTLSGGQCQRVAVARALYSSCQFVILDDPFSALDAVVAKHVIDVGVMKLLARRTVLLVTHHLPVLNHAHHIIAMENGSIKVQGSLAEIKRKESELVSHWQELMEKKEKEIKTAKERWTLLKLVSKFGFGVGRPPPPRREVEPSPIHHFRSRKGTFSHYKNLSDFFLPGDELYDELLSPTLQKRRRTSRASRESRTSVSSAGTGGQNRHVSLQRLSSLQPLESTSPNKKFMRLMSENPKEVASVSTSPQRVRSEASRLASNSEAGGLNSEPLLKRLFSTKKKRSESRSSTAEPDTLTPVLPPAIVGPSSVQSESELTEYDESQENHTLLNTTFEEREFGKVPLRVYFIYANACGYFLSGTYLTFALGYEVVRVLNSFWLSHWSDSVAQEADPTLYQEEMRNFFHGYVLLSTVTVAVSLTCSLIGKAAGARSRELLHDNFLNSLLDAPLAFFESTPIGRILARASSDMAVIDRKLIISVQRFLQFLFLCLSAVVVNGVVNPWLLLLALPLIAIYYVIQRVYRVSSRELQRIQAISRGPILSHFHETLQGLSTIRAYGRQRVFTDLMFLCIDLNNRADMFINVGNRWLSISLDYLGGVIVAVASIGAVVSADIGLVTPSVVGLAINYTLLVPVYLNWVVKFLAEVEMFMNSVDRLDRFSKINPEEASDPKNFLTPPPSWPSKGTVEFEKVSISYETTPVISGLSLTIEGGQKVGICGRSGCGKSTLLSSLFRLSGKTDGRILIDGIDIHKLSVRKLRAALCIIPQNSVLFTAPLRFNLDPGGRFNDDDLWKAIDMAQLKDTVHQFTNKLDEIMNPDSLSAGQRQLVALAIAILHKSHLVIMDEATSNVDADTEQIILQATNQAFPQSTVVSIAHRLRVIAVGDRAVVLDKGQVVEDGSPSNLLARNPKSIFANMLQMETQSSL